MLGKKGSAAGVPNQVNAPDHPATEITYVRQTDVSKELGAPNFSVLGQGIELKHSYFDQLKQVEHPISNFSPEFHALPSPQYEPPYEIKVFRPIEGNAAVQGEPPKSPYEPPKSPYEIRYKPGWDSKILSVDDLRSHLASKLEAPNQ